MPSSGHPPLQLHYPHPENRHDGPICVVIRLRTDLCLLPTPWPWQPRQLSFPAIRPWSESYRPQTALRDIDAARFQHFMHLSHRNPLGLLLDQSLPQTIVQHIAVRLSLGGTSFANSPSIASKSISASLKRFAGIVHLPAVSRIRNQARILPLARQPVNSALRTAISSVPPRSKAGPNSP